MSITRTTRTRRSATRAALLAALAALAATTACATTRTTTVESGGDVGAGVIPVDAATLPAGVVVDARLDQALGTSQSKVGDTFTATVANAVAAQNGAVVVPAGAKITGRVTALEGSRNATEPAVIRLDFAQLAFEGRSYPFNAAVTRAVPQITGADTRGETLQKAGIGAAAGAALGAILSGGDLGKMAIGAVLGAAAGTAISLGVGNVDSTLPAGTTMTLRTTQSVALR